MVGILEDVADLGGGLGRTHRGAVAPVEHHGAGDRTQQAHQVLGERGLARAVLADDRDELARRDTQIDSSSTRRPVGVVELERAHSTSGCAPSAAAASCGEVSATADDK